MAIEGAATESSGAESLAVYVSVFEKLGLLAVIIGAALLMISPWLARRMR